MVAVGFMLWAGIRYGQQIQLHFFDGNFNAQRYCDEILRPIVLPFIRRHHFMLQHDNACHKDLYTIPGSWKGPLVSWPAYSPDVTHWACLRGSGSTCTTACSRSCQYPATSNSHWRGVGQHSTGQSTAWSTLCEGDVSRCMRQMAVTPDTDWFSYLHPSMLLRYL